LLAAGRRAHGATVFAYPVTIPSVTAWSSFDAAGRAVSLERKTGQAQVALMP